MSRGTTLTLYKKFNLKMDKTAYKEVINKYAVENKSFDYSPKKKPMSEYAKDIPIIMDIDAFRKDNIYDEETKTWKENKPENTIENLKNRVVGSVDSRDQMYCEKMMEWSFGSSFDCLIDHFNIGHGGFKDNVVEITTETAQKMLDAINYILGGEWNDNVARSMDNPYIKIFTEGYHCDSYWKYVNRNKNRPIKTFKIKQDGYDITIKCPSDKVKKSEDDIECENEINESNESIEYFLDTFRSGLSAFLKSDNWNRYSEHDKDNSEGWLGYNKEYKYVLTYEYWG